MHKPDLRFEATRLWVVYPRNRHQDGQLLWSCDDLRRS